MRGLLRLGSWCVVALALVVACAVRPVSGVGPYDPCAAQDAVTKGDSIAVGLAYWPGGSLEDWKALHPCFYADRQELIKKKVATMVFRPKVDNMAHFRGAKADEDALFAKVSGADVMTLVAYAGNGTNVVRSEPRVVRTVSSDAGVYGGRVEALTLIARFDAGRLQYLQWHDMGCAVCGGAKSEACMDVGGGNTACSTPETDCACTGENCKLDMTGADALKCMATVSIAYSGTDKHSTPLKTGMQIERLGAYSASEAGRSAGAQAASKASAISSQAQDTANQAKDGVSG